MSLIRLSILCLMPPQLYERVDEWTHEPRSNFKHKKRLSNACTCLLIFIFTSLQSYPKPKTPLSHHISCIIALVYFHASYLFYCICYFIFNTLCLTITRWSWGRNTRRLFCRLPDKNKDSFLNYSPRVWYKPQVTLVGKIFLLQHSALGVPTNWHVAYCHHLYSINISRQHVLIQNIGENSRLYGWRWFWTSIEIPLIILENNTITSV
jgi:hypothetical protein